MKALVYHGPGRKAWEDVPKPTIVNDSDAIVRVDATTICGTDLHILKGDVTAVTDGRILGHEAVGTGPIGLSAIMVARLFSPSHIVAIDLADSRLDAAKQFGADIVVNNSREDAVAIVAALTGGLGADVAIEAVGVPATFELATQLARPGGHIANIGVHGEPATLHLEQLWSRDVTITTGLVDTYTTPTLLKLMVSGRANGARFVTHHFDLDDFMAAYDTFGRAAETAALKVVLTRN